MTKDQASAHIEATANELLTAVYHAINNTKLDIAWMKDVARRSTAALTAAAEVGTEAEENHRMGFVSATASDGSKWDRWYANLPSDLRRKLSLHDFKRLGDLFDTAAAEADRGAQTGKALTGSLNEVSLGENSESVFHRHAAAAEVGLPVDLMIKDAVDAAIVATIDRCAQVADAAVVGTWPKDIAAAIRTIKDK